MHTHAQEYANYQQQYANQHQHQHQQRDLDRLLGRAAVAEVQGSVHTLLSHNVSTEVPLFVASGVDCTHEWLKPLVNYVKCARERGSEGLKQAMYIIVRKIGKVNEGVKYNILIDRENCTE
jgi:hypothetical protein